MIKIKELPDVETLRDLLAYNPSTGSLIWKHRPPTTPGAKGFNKRFAGKAAGYVNQGYLKIRIPGVKNQLLAHRVIWKMMTGLEPSPILDHEDTNSINNRWKNLREANDQQSARNRKSSKAGVKGVYWIERLQKWTASICVCYKQIYLGCFDTIGEAESVINEARAKLHGEFARAA